MILCEKICALQLKQIRHLQRTFCSLTKRWGHITWLTSQADFHKHASDDFFQIESLVQAINQCKLKRDFMLSFSEDPVGFINQWVASQSRDLEVTCEDWSQSAQHALNLCATDNIGRQPNKSGGNSAGRFLRKGFGTRSCLPHAKTKRFSINYCSIM